MNNSESAGLLATLREVTELLAGLDLASLPKIWCVQVAPDFHNDGLTGKAQLYTRSTELDAIDAIRTWAAALGGVVLLGDEVIYGGGSFRDITAVLRLPSGAVFEVWDHLSELRPSPGWVPADSGLIPV